MTAVAFDSASKGKAGLFPYGNAARSKVEQTLIIAHVSPYRTTFKKHDVIGLNRRCTIWCSSSSLTQPAFATVRLLFTARTASSGKSWCLIAWVGPTMHFKNLLDSTYITITRCRAKLRVDVTLLSHQPPRFFRHLRATLRYEIHNSKYATCTK